MKLWAYSAATIKLYLVEPVTDKTERIKDLGETGYMIYVLDNGEKIEGISGASNADIMVTDVQGQCAITVVGTNGSNMSSKEVLFNGLTWNDVVTGTYVFGTKSIQGGAAADIVGKTSVPTTLQVCTTNPDLYRFKDVFGTGYSMKINLIDLKGSDKDGKEYQYFRVPSTLTPFTYGDHGSIKILDIGYWQGNDAFVTTNGYESGIYENYDCFISVAYIVSAGFLGYGYDYFIAD